MPINAAAVIAMWTRCACMLLHTHTIWQHSLHTQVPGTVLAALIKNGDVPDPNIGLDSLKVPDIGVEGEVAYTYWYCAQIEVDGSVAKDSNLFWLLELDGINYSFELFVNGSAVPAASNRGMFLRHRIYLEHLIVGGRIFKMSAILRSDVLLHKSNMPSENFSQAQTSLLFLCTHQTTSARFLPMVDKEAITQ